MSLADVLAARIRADGPMTVAEWMAACLLHPSMGYYTTREPFGAKGDFVTAPEISQMFGELAGLCLAQAWLDQGRPPAALAEGGPGRGTLMADLLRATKGVPGFPRAPHLIEASPRLRALQTEAIPAATHHDTVEALPDGPLLFVANELLDALPIRQAVRDGDAWRERVVTWDDGFALALAPPAPMPHLAHHDVPDGTLVEWCPALPALIEAVGRRVARGGAALFVDYGHWRARGDTLQALRNGRPADPLAHPGEADLTAHVDFEAIARAAPPGTASTAMTTQGEWLERLGITARAQTLAARDVSVAAAHRRLTHPEEMGDLFKAIALHPEGTAPPPGFP
ncbi:SAM-dependent methyltransferase [Jannaschia sp. Os4]|uniref:class I SAM-dependent methyltransferase n=1 Tax=Jannaschia sp. Os4 TaxID=2807617 RepID=UPI001939737E|nr:SAM-dependent methyltransferase [Jannaschia sp. Os4]MBM2574840.1 SAM-dependent methyltransferase [Jannaschia sp. Os4]